MKACVRLLPLLLFLLRTNAVLAQPTGRIEGVIRDDSGAPLAGLSAQITRGGETLATQTTDAGGHFAFGEVSDGKYLILVKLADGTEYPLEAAVSGGATVSIDQQILTNVGRLERMTVY